MLTLPTYMQFLLDLELEEMVLEPIDTDELTRLAKEALGKQSRHCYSTPKQETI